MINIFYLISAVCFILGIKKLSHPKTARNGNALAALGMLIAIVTVLCDKYKMGWEIILLGIGVGAIIGLIAAIKVEMTQMPQLVAIFNGFGGGASALIASAEFLTPQDEPTALFKLSTIMFSVIIGTLTFTGSFIAFGKLQGFVSSKPITYPGQQIFNALIAFGLYGLSLFLIYNTGLESHNYFYLIIIISALIGITLTIPIGGADMPVVISLLNSYSGVAAAGTGFVLENNALIISGALVGASGLI